MKTYSVATQNKDGIWFTNWYTYNSPDDIDWDNVRKFCIERGNKAYGYYYGHNSNALTSARCRTVKEVLS